ncbi:MAG TPA: HDOD domain-containing protein, partial [Planctomycetota bacterium]|nr:HDOD domain-containing protein [Planctomycetota bacterium]
AAKMLRMVNSPLYGTAGPVSDLQQAVTILGFKAIRSIAMSASIVDLSRQDKAGFSMRDYWAHGMVCAALCRSIAEHAGLPDPELAFVVGLLKDMGKLVLVDHAPDELRAIVAIAREHGLSFGQAAREVLETDDAELCAWLCSNWKLPQEIVDAVAQQYELILKPDMKLVATMQCAEYLCAVKRIRVSGDCHEPIANRVATKVLGLDEDDLRTIIAAADEESAKAKELLALMAA